MAATDTRPECNSNGERIALDVEVRIVGGPSGEWQYALGLPAHSDRLRVDRARRIAREVAHESMAYTQTFDYRVQTRIVPAVR